MSHWFSGQSDIKKLRRENYQLRREIWSLRDEYDRLDKLLRNKNCNGNMDSSMDNDDELDGDDYKCDSCQSDDVSNLWIWFHNTDGDMIWISMWFRFWLGE